MQPEGSSLQQQTFYQRQVRGSSQHHTISRPVFSITGCGSTSRGLGTMNFLFSKAIGATLSKSIRMAMIVPREPKTSIAINALSINAKDERNNQAIEKNRP